jgi:hypothetical protein
LIRESYAGFTPLSLHNKALELYKTYLVIGGIPHAVAEYMQSGDFDFVTAIQKNLNDAKYAMPQESTRIMSAWDAQKSPVLSGILALKTRYKASLYTRYTVMVYQ